MIVFLVILSTCFLGLDIAAKLNPPRYYVNTSPSMPLSLYKLIPFDGHLKAGDIIIFDVPQSARPYIYGRGWLPKGWPLIKKIGAVPGDQIWITEDQIWINGKYIGPIFRTDTAGLPLPRLQGSFMIPEGYCLPISTYIANSFDGRYFGAIPFRLIRGKALPIFTLK